VKEAGYVKLEIYELAHDLAVRVHAMTMGLPRFELYEEGSQVRKSAKSVVSNIVEGYGRKAYPADWLRFLTYAHASCDETRCHLRLLRDTGSLAEDTYAELDQAYDRLGRRVGALLRRVAAEDVASKPGARRAQLAARGPRPAARGPEDAP
jgi:four helix bundle protein